MNALDLVRIWTARINTQRPRNLKTHQPRHPEPSCAYWRQA